MCNSEAEGENLPCPLYTVNKRRPLKVAQKRVIIHDKKTIGIGKNIISPKMTIVASRLGRTQKHRLARPYSCKVVCTEMGRLGTKPLPGI